ncbi:hypothetical protein [Tessaracoccus coleopterorum]|nr:hypothetical protein [Tessaracoccus coleopterorum]
MPNHELDAGKLRSDLLTAGYTVDDVLDRIGGRVRRVSDVT